MKHFAIFALVIIAAASLFVLASKPPAGLVVDTVTGGEGPATQAMTDANPQPVSIVNWIIDESGNIKVTNVVRERVIALLPAPITLPSDTNPWYSDFIPEVGRFNSVQVRFEPISNSLLRNVGCHLEWKWADGVAVEDETELTDHPETSPRRPSRGFTKFAVRGKEVRVACTGPDGESPQIDQIWVYLRAE